MSASSVSVQKNDSPQWLSRMPPEEASLFSLLIPCLFPNPSASQIKKSKKYIPIVFQNEKGETIAEYLYAPVLKMLGLSAEIFMTEEDSKKRLETVKKALQGLSESQQKIIADYRTIFQLYLENRNRPDVVRIQKSFLAELIFEVHKHEISIVSRRITFCEKKFNFFRDANGKLVLVGPSVKLLGIGATSTVKQHSVISHGGILKAVKKSDPKRYGKTNWQKTKDTRAVEQCNAILMNEHKILVRLYHDEEKKIHPGVIGPNELTYSVQKPKISTWKTYLLQESYCGNLEEFMKKERGGVSNDALLSGILQLLKGLVLLKNKKVLHGDIKKENILYNYDEKLDFFIADFGGSLLADELSQSGIKKSNGLGTICSPCNISRDDAVALQIAATAMNFSEWSAIHYARDLAAVGIVAYLILAQIDEYDLVYYSSAGCPKVNFKAIVRDVMKEKLSAAGFESDRLVDFLLKMMHPDWSMRITAESAVEELQSIIENPTPDPEPAESAVEEVQSIIENPTPAPEPAEKE